MSHHPSKSISNPYCPDPYSHGSRLLNDITSLLNTRKNRILLVAESSMQASQFKAFRQLFLDELGKSGLESDLNHLLSHDNYQCITGVEWAGIDYAGKEVPK